MMKKIKSNLIGILLVTIIGFCLVYFTIEYVYNLTNTTYKVQVEGITEEINEAFFYDALAKYDDNGELIGYSYSSVDIAAIFANEDIQITQNEDSLSITIKARYFINSQGILINQESFTRFNKVIQKVITFHNADALITNVEVEHNIASLIWSILGAVVFLSGGLIYILWKPYKERSLAITHPFQKKFWQEAILSMRKMRVFDLCFIAIMFALQMICKLIVIPTGFANLGVGITYLIFSLICMIYGPIWGLVIGFFSDVLGFALFPNGSFFYFGYTLQAMLTGFIYGLCLYRNQATFSRVLISRIIVNIFINAIMGAYLWKIVADLTYAGMRDYFYYIALPKNIIFLLPQVFLMYGFFRLVKPIVENRNLINLRP